MRGGGNAAAQALFWQPKKGNSFTVAFQSERERNAAIMLARRFASDCNVRLYLIKTILLSLSILFMIVKVFFVLTSDIEFLNQIS